MTVYLPLPGRPMVPQSLQGQEIRPYTSAMHRQERLVANIGDILHTCSQSPGRTMVITLPVAIPGELYWCGRPTQVETLSPTTVTQDSCVASPGLQTAHTSHPAGTLGIARCRYGPHLAETWCILTGSNIGYLALHGRLMGSVLVREVLVVPVKPGMLWLWVV